MSKEHSVKYELAEETGILGKNLLQFHKSYMTKPGIEPWQPWWDAGLSNGTAFRKFVLFLLVSWTV
jgi:8-oxo-dGTP pyrophosphatase MutT (NUDIX family)